MKRLKVLFSIVIVIALLLGMASGALAAGTKPDVYIWQTTTGMPGVYKLVMTVILPVAQGEVITFGIGLSYDNTVIVAANASTGAPIASPATGNRTPFTTEVGSLTPASSFVWTTAGTSTSVLAGALSLDPLDASDGIVGLEFYFTLADGKTLADITASTFGMVGDGNGDKVTVGIEGDPVSRRHGNPNQTLFPDTIDLYFLRMVTGYYADTSDTALTLTATVPYGTSEANAKLALPGTAEAKLSDGSYVTVTIAWTFSPAYNGNSAGAKTATGVATGAFPLYVTAASISGTVTVSPALTIDGYYKDGDGTNTPLVTTDTVEYGSSEAAAKTNLSTSGYALLSDGNYIPITIVWSFVTPYNGEIDGAKPVTGAVSGPFPTGTTPTNQTGTVTVSPDGRTYYNVTWNVDGGAPAPTQTRVVEGGTVNRPAAMTKAGYVFEGWYEDEDFEVEATFPVEDADDDMTFWAKWEENPITLYNVTWVTNGGSPSPSQTTVEEGGTIGLPESVSKAGYTFGGWYESIDFIGNAVNFPVTNVMGDKTYYAKWTTGGGGSGWNNPYADVKGSDWFYDAVRFVTENGLMNGVGNNLFGPNLELTRGMLATIIYRLEGEPACSAANPFVDVKNQYYKDAVIWANANGVMLGYGNGFFGGDDLVTREQLVTVLFRYAKFKGVDVSARGSLDGFTDANKVSGYAVEAMQWAVAVGIINGRTATTIVPQGTATRAEVATMFMRYMQKVLGK